MRNRPSRRRGLVYLAALALALMGSQRAGAETISPTDARAIRVLGGGSPFFLQPGLLSIQLDPGFLEDRTVALFNLTGLAGPVPLATLDLDLIDLDPGGTTGSIDLFAFVGSGTVTPALFDAGTFVTSVSVNDSGLIQVEVTGAVQAALESGQQFLGFRLSTTGEDRFVTGSFVGRPTPQLNVATTIIPEPSGLVLLGLGSLCLLGYWRRRLAA